jgi:hypothetical protein
VGEYLGEWAAQAHPWSVCPKRAPISRHADAGTRRRCPAAGASGHSQASGIAARRVLADPGVAVAFTFAPRTAPSTTPTASAARSA